MTQKNKKIIITGCNGFIGMSLIKELLKTEKYNIVGIDYNDTSEKKIDVSNAANYKFIFADLTDTLLEQKVNQADLVIHLASPIGVSTIKNNPAVTFNDAVNINNNILKFCKLNNTPIIFASSSEVYGTGDVYSDTDDYKLPSVANTDRGSYALQKILMEYEIKFSNLKAVVVRFFNIVGPSQKTKGMILPTFVRNAFDNKPLNILENGFRSYCDISDAVFQLCLIIEEIIEDENTDLFRTINVGNPDVFNKRYAVEIADKVIDTVKAVYDTTSEVVFIDTKKVEIPRRVLFDENQYNKNIPNMHIDTIIKNIVDEYKKELQ